MPIQIGMGKKNVVYGRKRVFGENDRREGERTLYFTDKQGIFPRIPCEQDEEESKERVECFDEGYGRPSIIQKEDSSIKVTIESQHSQVDYQGASESPVASNKCLMF